MPEDLLTRSVNVGSELSGTVRSVLVDVNDKIKKAAESGVYDDSTLSDAQRKAISAAMAEVAGSVAATDDTVKESVAATDDAVKEEN